MDKEKLLKNLASLGYQLFETDEQQDVNGTLAEIIKSNDIRLWEGFPVVLVTVFERGLFDMNKIESYLDNDEHKQKLQELFLLSFAVYKCMNFKKTWIKKYVDTLSKDKLTTLTYKIKHNKNIGISNYEISSERLLSIFKNYSNQLDSGLEDMAKRKRQIGLDYSLSQIFSPRQKELFLKKSNREKMNKTEQEYYSRVVKKKVVALANSELHGLAKQLLS
jgi:hypothetical protein